MKGWKLFAPLLILVIIAVTLYLRLHTQPLLLQGEADATNVIVASKAKGRVEVLHVRRGDDVKQGQVLISLSSPELQAQLDSLRAARNQVQANLDESLHGTREETLRALQASLSQAQAELRNAELEYQRNEELAGRGFVSQAQMDLSRRGRDVARNRVTASPRPRPISTRVTRATARSAVRRCKPPCAEPTPRYSNCRRRPTTSMWWRRWTARSDRSRQSRVNWSTPTARC
ncbi:multidrug resistance efflux pump [Pseudomonas nitroreducens]|nr:multidrug resistance efflux pump [Pseudomonas nitroreducens]